MITDMIMIDRRCYVRLWCYHCNENKIRHLRDDVRSRYVPTTIQGLVSNTLYLTIRLRNLNFCKVIVIVTIA